MTKRKAQVVCPVFQKSRYPYHSLGVKLGDPFAIAYKVYITKNFAVAVDAGTVASGLYYKYHKNIFPGVASKIPGPNESVRYLNHAVETDFVAEGKMLYQINASRWLQNLQLYTGVGWQWRKLNILYEYFLEEGSDQREINKLNYSRFTFGPTATVGVEYSYSDLPLSAFMEIEGYADVREDPGWMRFQGGAGLRYIF